MTGIVKLSILGLALVSWRANDCVAEGRDGLGSFDVYYGETGTVLGMHIYRYERSPIPGKALVPLLPSSCKSILLGQPRASLEVLEMTNETLEMLAKDKRRFNWLCVSDCFLDSVSVDSLEILLATEQSNIVLNRVQLTPRALDRILKLQNATIHIYECEQAER